MINYYSELRLSPVLSVEDLKAELFRLKQAWTNREIKTPEIATEKLVLIEEAQKVFASSSSKVAYDRELEKSSQEEDVYALREDRYRKALLFCRLAQYDIAAIAIEEAIRYTDPTREDSLLYNRAAEIYLKTKEYGKALGYINKAIVLEPDDIYLYLVKGRIFQEKYEEADKANPIEANDEDIKSARNAFSYARNCYRTKSDKASEADALAYLSLSYYYPVKRCIVSENNLLKPRPSDIVYAYRYAKRAKENGTTITQTSQVIRMIEEHFPNEIKKPPESGKSGE